MAKKSYLELAYEDDIKKNTGKDRDKVTYRDLANIDDEQSYVSVYKDAISKLSNSAIYREPKELTGLQNRASAAAYGQTGDVGKFFSDVKDLAAERVKYYNQFGSKQNFVGAQLDNMDKRVEPEPLTIGNKNIAPYDDRPVVSAGSKDIFPKNTNDYLRYLSDQMTGDSHRYIAKNPTAEMMEKQKFFQQTAHDPKALQFAKFRGEYDQMGRDDRLDFEKSAINAERKKLTEDSEALESEYYSQYAKLFGANMYFDDYEAEWKKLNELNDKRTAYPDRLSMLDSMQGQVESTQRWNETKDKYAPYLYAEDFEQNSKYNLSIPEGKADEFLKRPDNYGASYEYAYVNEPEMFKDSPLMNDSREFMDYLSDDERKVYNYIYNTKGNKAANQMLDDMREQLSARRSYEQEKGAAAYAKEYPVLSFLNARGQNLMKSTISPLQFVATMAGAGADDPIFDVNRVSESIDATNAQELSKAFGGVEIPFVDADAGEVVYGILSSGADAAAAMGIGKLLLGSNAAVQGIMSSGAASSAMKNGLERGMEPWKAATMGVMGGLIEAVTEKYSIEALFSPVDKKAWRFFLKNVFTEGSEELASSALNRITDGIMNADKSEIAQRAIEIARTNGIPLEQAKKQARAEWLQQAGVEFISGAVMGGVFAAPKALVSSVKNKSNPTPPTVTEQIAQKEAEIAQKESEAYENAARERMDFETRDGEAAKKYSELVKLVNESFPEESETKAKIAEAATIDTKRMTEIATGAMQELRARMQAEASPEVLKLSETLAQTVEGIFAGMQTDRNAIADKYIAGLDEGLKAEIKGKNDADYAKGYGIAHALGTYDVDGEVAEKITGFGEAKTAAEKGREKWRINLPATKSAAEEQLKKLPAQGKGGATVGKGVNQDKLSKQQKNQIGFMSTVGKYLGVDFVFIEFAQDADGNYVTGDGRVAPNGFYRGKDGKIYIDVNAGKTPGRSAGNSADNNGGLSAQAAIIPLTAGHELGHLMKSTMPEVYNQLVNAVIDEMISKGVDVKALIEKQMGKAKLSNMTPEGAIEEMVNEATSGILQDSQAVRRMAEKNPGLVKRIAEWVKDFVARIRKAFANLSPMEESESIMEMRNGVRKYTEKITSIWDSAFTNRNAPSAPGALFTADVGDEGLNNTINSRINDIYRNLGENGKKAFNEFMEKVSEGSKRYGGRGMGYELYTDALDVWENQYNAGLTGIIGPLFEIEQALERFNDETINGILAAGEQDAKGNQGTKIVAEAKPATVTRKDVQAVAKEAAAKKTAYTSDGQAVDYHYEIAPVGSLIPSNLEISLEPNPDYPQELQPRDRTRAASQQQVEEIANKLNPALLGESADVGTGAPFVGPDMVVESGNGRILAITRAMRQGKGLTYTQWLKDNAARFGIDPAKVDNASVLVRVRDTEVNRPEFVQKANESQVATYSDSESAVSDAKKVTPAMLEMANMDSGDINSAGNSSFVSSFISKVVPVAERGRMMDASGKLSKSGENRVRTALFQMAYEDGYLTEQMAEASDDTSKNILKAMTAVAPRLALMNDAMKKGTLSDYPIGQAIAEAYRIVQRQKRLGVSVDRYINQQSLVRQDTPAHWMLLEMFNENRKAPSRMADALNSILNAAERQGNPNQMLMPGLEAERPSVEGIVRDGLNRYADEGMAASERDTLKFQMRAPVEETAKLIAVHNLSEAQLLSSVDLGGFAMPSIAVIRAGQPHDRYGDISIVFGKETIDPENYGNKVYGGDAWTPSFPEIQYEIGYDEVDGIRKKVKAIVGDELYRMLNSPFDEDNLQQEANRNRGDFGEAFQRHPLLIAAYLKSIGEQANIVKSIPTFSNSFDNETVDLIDKKIGDRLVDAGMGGYDDLMALEPEVRKIINDNWSEKNVTDDTPEWRKTLYKNPFPYAKMDGLAAGIVKKRNWDGEAKVDRYETERELVKQISGDKERAAYKSWVNGLLGKAIVNKGIRNNADTFTPSGSRRSFSATHWAVTLENVVRAMRSQEGKGSDSWGSSGLFGVSTKNYSSLDDIRKDIDRLQQMDEEQYQEKKDEFQNRIVELAGEIARPSERNRFIALDNAAEVLTEAARKGTTAGIQRVLNGYKDYYNIREDTAKKLYKLMSDISRMPTEYFEAKPERAVGFDEVRAVVLPNTAGEGVKKALSDMQVPVIEYKSGDNTDRLKALNSPELDGVKFQERDTQYLSAVEAGDMDTAQKMVDEAAKAAGYEVGPVYHGTSAKFNTFRHGDIGFHFGTKSQARTRSGYGRNAVVISANLNMQNPLRVSNDYGSWDADYAAKWMLEDGHITQGEYREIMNTPSSKQNKAMRELLIRKGYDGVEYVNQFEGRSPKPSYIVFLSSQAKRTDPVTYDDSGNPIPLSQRFTDSNDIRYQERDSVPKPKLSSKQITEILQEIDVARPRDVKQSNYLKNGIISRLREKGITHIDAYHVTDASEASLQDKGILGSELDYVGRTSGNLRESSVYVFLDPDDIELGYGGITGISESTNNVVHLLIPINKITDMYPDYNFGVSFDTYSSVRFVGDMPSNYIDGVYKINKPAKDIRYQERDPDYRTKRDILAGAFDSVAQTEGEKRNLKEYKNLIGSLNRMEEEARGLRQANTAERKKPDRDKTVIESNTKRIAEIEERINNLDKRLMKMQNAAPLQNVLKREVDYYKRQQSALSRQQLEKYRADRAETSMKQRYRNDISKGVKALNNTLMNESDQKHIPEGFKAAVIEFLKLFTDNTSVFDYKRLSVLKEMYGALVTSDSELAGMYDFDIAQDIADAARLLEGKRLSQLTEAELEKMRDIVAHFNHIVKNENQIFTQKRSVKTTDAAEEGLSEYGKKAKEMRLALLNGKNPIAAINKFLTSKNVKPVYFFKRVGGILQELFDDIRAAQGKWAFRMSEDRAFFRDTVNKYNYYKWVDDGQLTFKTARGDQITLTRDQALELYAINKREKTNKQQGAEHLAVGGFVYEDAVKVKKKGALGVPLTYEVNVGENHPLTDSDLEQISKWLTNEQRAFADEMVNYLSTVMGERGNEVSLALYGIRKYVEKYYFPYKSASNYLYSHQGGAQDDSAIKHRSFTRRTTVSANNPVVLTGFTKVWADHVQNMNLYNAMAVPLDNFNRVYNYQIRGDRDGNKPKSVKTALEAAYGKEANAYIKQLLNDVNGGIRPDKGDAEARKLMSLWKKGAVFASLSVVVQQPSAIGRALALIDPKYFRKGYTKAGYEEMMKWSGTANIKAMGRFDANMGMTAAGWLTQREYTGMDEKAKAFAKDGSFRDDVLSWLPQKADEMTWTALWEAVKRETASKYGNLIGSDAFMQKVAERFDEVVDYTQVYDSVLSRSEVMRSQSALAQMVTSFMAEPTTAYNMLLDSIANRKNKGMKNYVKPGRALGAFAVSVLLNSILKAMVTAGRDDDEKLTYLEKYLRKVSGNIVDELNPLGLVPYGRDILSLWEGYDIERADMSLIGDLINAAKKMSKTDTPILQRMDVLAGAIGNALGVPYKNVRRDIQGVYNVLANTAPMSRQSVSGAKYSILEGLPWFDSSRAGYARKLYSAIVKGDAQEEAGLREQISKIVKKDSDINTELRKIITTEFEEERLEPRTALQQMIDLTALKEVKGKIGDWYKDGLIGQDVAEQLLVEFTQDDQPNERYKTIEGWNFSKDPDNEGESYSTYKPFYDAIDSGKDLRAVVNTYMDPKKYGASKSTLSSRITDNYKEQYIETYKRSRTEAAALKSRLLNAYVLLGYDRAKKSKDIDAWLKQ